MVLKSEDAATDAVILHPEVGTNVSLRGLGPRRCGQGFRRGRMCSI